jgi:replicative DNA helicase
MIENNPDAAEQAVVGAILLRPDVVDDLNLEPEDFKDARLGSLYSMLRRMRHGGQYIDTVTVCDALARSGQPELRGINPAAIHDLVANTPSAASATAYEAIVARSAVVRRLNSAKAHMDQAAASDMSADDLVEAARRALDEVAGHVKTQARSIGEDMDEALEALEKPPKQIQSPWDELNDLIGGFQPGRLYVVGARPAVGKTVVGLQCALTMAQQGVVAFSSLEMSRDELIHRAISMRARVNGNKIASRNLTNSDWQAIAAASSVLRGLPLHIDDRSDVNVTQIRQHARRAQRRGPLAGIFIDYLQLMRSPRGEKRPRHEVVAEYSRQLKIMARELEVPVIALAQLNRNSTQRADGKPQMSDLRESGAVEQDSDVIILLHRDLDDPTKDRELNMHVAKNRQGQTGQFTLDFLGHYSKIQSRS